MSNQKIIHELQRVLADTYCLYLKTQNYHWNVEGPQFKSLHEMFEEQYTDMAAAIDETAEHIRGLGEKVDGRFATLQANSSIKDGDHTLKAADMVTDLIESHETITASIRQAADVADDIDDDVLEDFCIQRLQFHRKVLWMLKSSI